VTVILELTLAAVLLVLLVDLVRRKR